MTASHFAWFTISLLEVRAKARRDGVSIRALILQLLTKWVSDVAV